MLGNASANKGDTTKQPPCRAARRDGHLCTAPALASGFCFAHDPALAERRAEARAAGGKGKSTAQRLTKLVPASLKPVLCKLMDALDEVHDGTLEPRQASAMASLAGAITRLYETASLEERIQTLEDTTYDHAR